MKEENDETEFVNKDKKRIPQWSTIYTMMLGDVMCNFMGLVLFGQSTDSVNRLNSTNKTKKDGISIGAAWSVSWGSGLGTTIAISLVAVNREITS